MLGGGLSSQAKPHYAALAGDEWLQAALDESGVISLALTSQMSSRAANLADIHRDPADRFIIATSIETGAMLLTLDDVFKSYPELAGLLP